MRKLTTALALTAAALVAAAPAANAQRPAPKPHPTIFVAPKAPSRANPDKEKSCAEQAEETLAAYGWWEAATGYLWCLGDLD